MARNSEVISLMLPAEAVGCFTGQWIDIDPVSSSLNPLDSLWLFANNDNRICGTYVQAQGKTPVPWAASIVVHGAIHMSCTYDWT